VPRGRGPAQRLFHDRDTGLDAGSRIGNGGRPGLTDRIAIRLRANRLERRAGPIPRLDESAASITVDGPAPVRVLLFGTGAPAMGSGMTAQEDALGWCMAQEIAAAACRGVLLDSLVAEDWQPPDPIRALQDQDLSRYDVMVVISTYRRSLVDVPIDRWLGSVTEVRDLIIRSAGHDAIVEVLSLPWSRAAADAPSEWGGPLGRHIRTLDTLSVASLDSTPAVLRLTLSAPAAATEWIGSAFSGATYRRWGADVAAQLAPHLRLPPTGDASARDTPRPRRSRL
jgi:hypothetical protein